jgi:drug/metabolite transporter (DMT)-like permease
MVAVGSTVIASKVIADGLPPFIATLLRFAISSPVFFILILYTKQKIPKISTHDWIILFIQAGLGSVAYTVFLIIGMSMTTGANASVVVGSLPIVMGVFAIIIFGEKLTFRFAFSLVFSLLGILIATMETGVSTNKMAIIGTVFILLAVICEAFFMLLNKKSQNQLPAMIQASLMSGLGFLIALFPALYEYSSSDITSIEAPVFLSILYYAIIPTLIGSTFWYAGTLRTTASEAALATAIMPIAALMLSVFVLNEEINIQQIIGCILVLFAVND